MEVLVPRYGLVRRVGPRHVAAVGRVMKTIGQVIAVALAAETVVLVAWLLSLIVVLQ